MTQAEWTAEGTRLYGPDMLTWKFKCPICGNVQAPADFRQFKDRGATPNTAVQQCIGRFQSKPYCGLGNDSGPPRSPCDYASFGLFRLGIEVAFEGGKTITVFPFADSTESPR